MVFVDCDGKKPEPECEKSETGMEPEYGSF